MEQRLQIEHVVQSFVEIAEMLDDLAKKLSLIVAQLCEDRCARWKAVDGWRGLLSNATMEQFEKELIDQGIGHGA